MGSQGAPRDLTGPGGHAVAGAGHHRPDAGAGPGVPPASLPQPPYGPKNYQIEDQRQGGQGPFAGTNTLNKVCSGRLATEPTTSADAGKSTLNKCALHPAASPLGRATKVGGREGIFKTTSKAFMLLGVVLRIPSRPPYFSCPS